jgi:hypothetical protein
LCAHLESACHPRVIWPLSLDARPKTVHCGQLRHIVLGKQNTLIIDVSKLRIYGQRGVSGHLSGFDVTPSLNRQAFRSQKTTLVPPMHRPANPRWSQRIWNAGASAERQDGTSTCWLIRRTTSVSPSLSPCSRHRRTAGGLRNAFMGSCPAHCYPVTPRPLIPETVGTPTLLMPVTVTPLLALPNDLYEYIYKGNQINVVTHRHTGSRTDSESAVTG